MTVRLRPALLPATETLTSAGLLELALSVRLAAGVSTSATVRFSVPERSSAAHAPPAPNRHRRSVVDRVDRD